MSRMSNREFISALMQKSPMHSILITAILQDACDSVASTPRPTDHGKGMVSNILWWDICKQISDEFKERSK